MSEGKKRSAAYRRLAIGAAMAALLGVTVSMIRPVAADAPRPPSLTYAGRLETSDGLPLAGTHEVQLTVWNSQLGSARGSAPLCQTVAVSTTLVSGRFQLDLPDSCTVPLATNSDASLEVTIDGTSFGLARIGAIPYALSAGRATTAASADMATTAVSADNAVRATQDFAVGRNLTVAGDLGVAGRLSVGLRESLNCTTHGFSGSSQWVTDCTCNDGEAPLGGGGYSSTGHSLQESRSLYFEGTNGWRVACGDTLGNRVKCDFADVYCARIGP